MSNMHTAIRKTLSGCDPVLVIFIFFLLFSPPVIPQINTALFAAVYAGIRLITKYRKELFSALNQSGILRFSISIAVFLVYIATITITNYAVSGESVQIMHYVKLWYRFFLIVPVLMVCSLFICIRAKEREYSLYNLAMCFVQATMIQFVLALLALLIPQVKDFFISVIYSNTGDSYLNIPWVMARRGFGFSNSFVDSFGFGMGIIAVLPLFFLKEKRQWTICLVPCLIFVSFVNVRTGLIIAVIGLVVALPSIILAFAKMSLRGKQKAVVSVIVAILITVLLIALVFFCNPLTIQWILGDVVDMFCSVFKIPTDIFEWESSTPGETGTIGDWLQPDSDTTTSDILFSERFWNLPSGWTLLFGSGHTIYEADGYQNSDVGYVNDLWLGGIIGCLLLYGAFTMLFISAFRSSRDWGTRSLVIFLILSILVFQVKANAIMFNAGLNTLLPLTFFICYSNSGGNSVCRMRRKSA